MDGRELDKGVAECKSAGGGEVAGGAQVAQEVHAVSPAAVVSSLRWEDGGVLLEVILRTVHPAVLRLLRAGHTKLLVLDVNKRPLHYSEDLQMCWYHHS